MSFNDILKIDALENYINFSITNSIITLFLAFAIGLFITQIYKRTTSSVIFSSSFSISLITLCIITTFVILAVTSNIVLSLGMVGALSIVRFRTAIKEPIDIVFLFWSIAVGIVLGAGLISLALIGSIFIGIILLIFSNYKCIDTPYLVIITYTNNDAENEIINIISNISKKYKIKNKVVSKNYIENTIEIRLKNNDTQFVNNISNIKNVENVVLVNYNGEYIN